MRWLHNLGAFLRNRWRAFAAWWAFLIAGASLIFIAATLGREDTRALVSSMVIFACLAGLFLMARSPVTIRLRADAPVQTSLSPQLIVNEVRTAALVSYGQIGTVQVTKERAKPTGDFAGLLHPFVGEQLVMDVGVRVVAGVNLKHLREEDVHLGVDGRSADITLPPTKVMMVYVDESLTQVVTHRTGWLTRRDISMLDDARREAMESMVNAAVAGGLLERAGEQAAATVQGIARSLGLVEVRVSSTLPPPGAYFEELQDAESVARIRSLPVPPPGVAVNAE